MIEKLIAALGALIVVSAVALGIYWLVWKLWCWVLPQIWAGGPDLLIHPGYWLFSGAWLLVALVAGTLFGRK